MRLSCLIAALTLTAAACGDDGSTPLVDGPVTPIPDASPDGPVLPAGCDFAELNDGGNDILAGGSAEATNLTLAQSSTMCGTINNGHFADGAVDLDTYSITLAADSSVLLSVAGTGLEAIDGVDVLIVSDDGQGNLGIEGSGIFLGDHAIANADLAAGTYQLVVLASAAADIAGPVDYKLKIAVDMPTTRCPKATAAANFTEANDGAQSTGNDMVDVKFLADPPRALTANAADAPEPTAITTANGMTYRFTGTSANVNAADEYMDRDTFLFKTGPMTNQISVRLNWPGTTDDFDFLIFPADTTDDFASGTRVSNMEDEFATFAVLPNTDYWLWIGSYDGSTGLPVTYDATICDAPFTP
jgi:hypothetical protein